MQLGTYPAFLFFDRVFCFDAGLVGGTLGIDITINEFDDRHRGHVAITETGLEDADITAVALFVARAQHIKEFGDVLVLLELACGLTARVQIAAFAKRDEFSTTRRSSFAFGSVVLICSCSMSEPAMFAQSALRCSWVRFRRR